MLKAIALGTVAVDPLLTAHPEANNPYVHGLASTTATSDVAKQESSTEWRPDCRCDSSCCCCCFQKSLVNDSLRLLPLPLEGRTCCTPCEGDDCTACEKRARSFSAFRTESCTRHSLVMPCSGALPYGPGTEQSIWLLQAFMVIA